MVEEAARLYGFPNLQELYIKHCDGITEKSIDCLLTLDNPLKKVSIYTEGVNGEDQLKKWENMAEKNN